MTNTNKDTNHNTNTPSAAPAAQATPILLASGNPAKQEELRRLLEGLPLAPVTPAELDLAADPDETGETHEQIAREKAQEWSRQGSMLVIASDGGLVVPSLGLNWESRYTHRFAGPAADDAERRRRLLELMRPHPGAEREASWVEALAIADWGRPLKSWELKGASGVIAENAEVGEAGDTGETGETAGIAAPTAGFWFFTLWYFPQFGKYYNRLTDAEKASLGDHWTVLRRLVKAYFLEEFPATSGRS
jgi:inosine/xanthosine triphosphate pyrophosphatase family protein